VRAFQVFVRTYPGAELHFVGDGPGLEATRLLAQQLNIDQRIVFHGWLDDPRDTVSACDIFVLASEYEGFSLSAVEAMASGLPVILGLGQAESLSLLSVAKIVSLDDQAIAQAMLDVATDDDLAADLRVRGLAFARAHSIEETGRSYVTLFQQILEREGHEPR
jgi:glycosyltransferase involved in cell wall biosynthesis